MKLIFKIRPLYFCDLHKQYGNLLIFTRTDGSITDLIVESYNYHPQLHPVYTEYKNLIKKL